MVVHNRRCHHFASCHFWFPLLPSSPPSGEEVLVVVIGRILYCAITPSQIWPSRKEGLDQNQAQEPFVQLAHLFSS